MKKQQKLELLNSEEAQQIRGGGCSFINVIGCDTQVLCLRQVIVLLSMSKNALLKWKPIAMQITSSTLAFPVPTNHLMLLH